MENKQYKIDYFFDGFNHCAGIEKGHKGFFMLSNKSNDWKFIVPGTVVWDGLIQDCYHQYHDYSPCKDIEITKLPPLPNIPNTEPVKWHENFENSIPLNPDNFPNLTKYLKKTPEQKSVLAFLLKEDPYETYFGDGTFYYLSEYVFFNEYKAKTIEKELNKKSEFEKEKNHNYTHRYHLKKFTIQLINNSFKLKNYEPKWPEHYKIDEVLKLFEKMLEKK